MKPLFLLPALLAATPATAHPLWGYPDYKGPDAGHLVLSLTAGNLGGVEDIQVRFHRTDTAGWTDETIKWVPHNPFSPDDFSGPLDEPTRHKTQGLDLKPPAEGDYRTDVEVVNLQPGKYQIDWVGVRLRPGSGGGFDYKVKFTPTTEFEIKPSSSEYAGAFTTVAVGGAAVAKTWLGNVSGPGIAGWLLVFSDEADRDLPIARTKAELGPLDRAPALERMENLEGTPP
jgi:hypothetical protein